MGRPERPSTGWLPSSRPRQVALTATYYDTPALRLARAGITLRRRTGGSDAGWTMKLPVGGGREEHGEPLGEDDEPVPAALLDLVRAWVRDHEVRPVATLSTARTVHLLVGPSGRAAGRGLRRRRHRRRPRSRTGRRR